MASGTVTLASDNGHGEAASLVWYSNGSEMNGSSGLKRGKSQSPETSGTQVNPTRNGSAAVAANGQAWRLAKVFNENDEALINRKLPKELLLRIFSHLDVVSLCRCAQVSVGDKPSFSD